MFKELGAQLRKPSGFFGQLVAKMMNVRNKGFYEKMIRELNIQKEDKIFEIGYGPGLGIYSIAHKYDCSLAGIDFSELMYKKASKKNKKIINKGIVNLSFGDLLNLEPKHEEYNKVFCLNVIYFWDNLNKPFTRVLSMLKTDGEYWIYMAHEKEIGKLKFTKEFSKYTIENVEAELKNAGFKHVESNFDKGYFIKAIK